MRRPHSSTFVRTFETPSQARCAPAELRDRVVAVLVEDARVQAFGSFGADAASLRDHRQHSGDRTCSEELVEKQTPQRLGRARVAREERAFDRLWQIRQREDRSVGVGEVRREGTCFIGRKDLDHDSHANCTLGRNQRHLTLL